MIVASIEIWPHGQQKNGKVIGVCIITNDGTGTAARGNYDVKLGHAGRYIGKPGAYKTGKVHNHLRRLSPYHLLHKALAACLGK